METIKIKTAYLAAGCFWGVQYKLDRLNGVTATEVGYIGGSTDNPTYRDICNLETGHAEVVKVTYDESLLEYSDLLHFFFSIHDPTTLNRQGPDIGTQYRSAIFTQDDSEVSIAKNIIVDLGQKIGRQVATQVESKLNYFTAEEYHQKYVDKNPGSCHIE